MGIEDDVMAILEGKAVTMENRLDVKTDQDMKFIPMTKMNMCYICGAVLFDESGKVLLIQEAKKSCRGTWYLPLGRLEQGETLIDGAKREVKEESGLECELTTLLAVESIDYSWMRFTFTGHITGGKLKTEAEQDAESLQAKFFSDQEIQLSRDSLRKGDILKLIQAGRKYRGKEPSARGTPILPVISPHCRLMHRVVLIDRSKISTEHPMAVLSNITGDVHIPSAIISHTKQTSLAVSVFAILQDAFGKCPNSASIRMCGILGIEHRGTGDLEDGVCVTSLVSLDLSRGIDSPPVASVNYQWMPVGSEVLQHQLTEGAKGRLVALL